MSNLDNNSDRTSDRTNEMTDEEAVRKISEMESKIHSLYEEMCKLAEKHNIDFYFSGIENTSYDPECREWNYSSNVC